MSDSVTIRRTHETDASAFVALLAEVAREDRWIATQWPFDVSAREDSVRDALRRRRVLSWSAFDGDALVGELSLRVASGGEPEIGMIVAASHRGRGIGRTLLQTAIAWAGARDVALSLRVFPDNAAALALYRKLGFVELVLERAAVPRREGPPRDALLMRRAP